MKRAFFSWTMMGLLAVTGLTLIETPDAEAGHYRHGGYRQYYSSWHYNEINTYYYRRYYYQPVYNVPTYSYHYVISYPSQPRYYYYYSPVHRHYWGRYDLEKKGYSILAEKDRKEKLEDIKEEAFPKPAAMPNIPDAKDKVEMEVPPKDTPKDPKDVSKVDDEKDPNQTDKK